MKRAGNYVRLSPASLSRPSSSAVRDGTTRSAPKPCSTSACAASPTPMTASPAACPGSDPRRAVRQSDRLRGRTPRWRQAASNTSGAGRECSPSRTDGIGVDPRPRPASRARRAPASAACWRWPRRRRASGRHERLPAGSGALPGRRSHRAGCSARAIACAFRSAKPQAVSASAGPSARPSGSRIPRLSRNAWIPSSLERPSTYSR